VALILTNVVIVSRLNDQCFITAFMWVFHYHLNQDPVLLPLEGTATFCLADRRSATSASSSCTRALASSRYFSCARLSRASCNPRYTTEPKRATGIMPGSRSEYHCAWADLPEVADWLYVRHRGLGLTDIVRCHVARSMIGRRDRLFGLQSVSGQ